MFLLLPDNPCVAEVGVAQGLFSEEILKCWNPKKLFLVDLWESNSSFPGDAGSPQEWHNKNYIDANNRVREWFYKVAPMEMPVQFLRGPSVRMSQYIEDKSLDLVYLDACHSYECVMADLKAYMPKLKKGAVMAGHDFLNKADYGVYDAVMEFTKGRYEVYTIPENKTEDAGFYFIV